ncbi:MAG: four helix bundle protein [Nitrospiraceae bacterium]
MSHNIIQQKSFAFAVRIVKLVRRLRTSLKGTVLSNQLLRAGAAIGAPVEEALGEQSKKECLGKLSIAEKEARETQYRLRPLREAGVLSESEANDALREGQHVLKMLTSLALTTRHGLMSGSSPGTEPSSAAADSAPDAPHSSLIAKKRRS